MIQYLTIGLIMLIYNFISAFMWDKVGRTAFDKIVSKNKFGIKQFGFYIATQIISTIIMSTILYSVITDPEI